MRRSRLPKRPTRTTVVEQLERRRLLTVLTASIPAHLDTSTAPQAAFPPGTVTVAPTSPAFPNSVAVTYYKFTTAAASAAGTVALDASVVSRTGAAVVALALFDADGNPIQVRDAEELSASLSAALRPGTPYELGVYADKLFSGSGTIALTVTTGPQRTGAAVVADPASGATTVTPGGGGGTTGLAGPADVNYFPLAFPNAGQSAQVVVSALNGDAAQVYAQLFEQPTPGGPYTSVGQGTASSAGGSVTLSVPPPSGGDVANVPYLLAVSPANFKTAAQPYQVTAQATSQVGPATVSYATAGRSDLPGGPLTIVAPGTVGAGSGLNGFSTLLFAGGDVGKVQAVVTGPLTFSLGATGPVGLSVYDAAGTHLLAAAGRPTSPGVVAPVLVTIAATAGTTYLFRAATDDNPNDSSFSLIAYVSVTQTYAPTVLMPSATTVGTVAGLGAAASGGAFFRVSPPAGADFVVVQATPTVTGAGGPAASLSTFTPGLGTQTFTGANGQPLVVPIDAAAGAVDVYVSPVSAGTVTLSYQAVIIPRSIAIGQLPTQAIDLKTGGFSVPFTGVAGGQLVGAQFWEPAPAAPETLSATGTGGAQAIVVRYVQQGNALVLDDRALPPSGAASVSAPLAPARLYAVAAIPLSLGGTGSVSVAVAGPAPAGVGVAMVPDPAPPATPAQALLRIRNVALASPYQRDVFSTLLPANTTGTAPQFTFAPSSSRSSLAATVAVYDPSGNVLYSGTTAPGGSLSVSLTGAASLGGQKLRFAVQPVAGQPLGDGLYTLTLIVPTTDPTPYLVTEPSFAPGGGSLNLQKGYLPAGTTPVAVPFGGAAVQGSFTSSAPYYGTAGGNAGAFGLYSFTLPGVRTTPFQVTTTDVDPAVNTDIGLYYKSGSTYYQIPNTSLNTDYDPGDRSPVDSRLVVNNTYLFVNLFPGEAAGNTTFYVVVKNEQGTTGRYTVAVGPTTDANVTPDPSTGVTYPGSTGIIPQGSPPASLPAAPPTTAPTLPSYTSLADPITPDGQYRATIRYAAGQSIAAGSTFSVYGTGLLSAYFTPTNFSAVAFVALYHLDFNANPHVIVTGGGDLTPAFGGGNNTISSTLVAYATDGAIRENFQLSASVSPGVYFFETFAPAGQPTATGSVRVDGKLPGYTATAVTLDPATAQNDQLPLRQVDKDTPFSQLFYQVTVPSDAISPITVNVTPVGGSATGGELAAFLWRVQADGTYLEVANGRLGTASSFIITGATDTAVRPGDHYYVGIYASNVHADVLVGPGFALPSSADPDLVVQPVSLTPANGKTRVSVTVTNPSYGTAGPARATLALTGKPTIKLTLPAMGPQASYTYTYDWVPGATTDTATFVANADRLVAESNFNNDSAAVALSSVDATAPTVSIALADAAMTAEPSTTTWGRYLSGVTGATTNINVTAVDADGNLYQILVAGPVRSGVVIAPGASSRVDAVPVDFGLLGPTSADNPNVIQYSVTDAYGLTARGMQNLDIVPKPQFYTTVTWDAAHHAYALGFVDNLIDYHKTVSQVLGASVPLVGDKDNQFTIGLAAAGSASLNPAAPVSLPLTGHIVIKALDNTFYDKTFDGSAQPTDHLSLHTTLVINPRTLDATAAAVSLQLTNLELFNLQTPLLKLFSFGLPGVASIDAGVRFGLSSSLSAGVKVGINPAVLTDPLNAPLRLGVLSPTFIEPSITGTATVEGDVNVLGFDLASLQGSVSLTLDVTAGLDNNDPSRLFSFPDFANSLAVKVDAILGVHLQANVILLGDIWDFDYAHTFPVADTSTQGIITHDIDGGAAGGHAVTGGAAAVGGGSIFDQLDAFLLNPASLMNPADATPAPVVKGGNALVGPYQLPPDPQVVIDPATGVALAVQGVNVSPTPATTTVGNLEFSRRAGGTWSPQQVLTSADANNPVLALTHDAGNGVTGAAVVYEGLNAGGATSPSALTQTQRLADADLRYRYYNGTGWSAEQSITNDARQDGSASTAFNAAGNGLVAWVHNTSASPMDAAGNYSAATQDVQAATWNPATHTFSAPVAISAAGDGSADAKPAAFIASNGATGVAWVRTLAATGASQLMLSTNFGGGFSTPAPLSLPSLPAGGSFGQVAIGSDAAGGVDILFSYRVQGTDRSVDTRLYNYAYLTGAVEQIAQDQNYSHLRTTNAPDGSLVAYWQQADGVTDGVYASTLARSSANPSAAWSTPVRLTSTTNLTQNPSVAVDTDGKFATLFNTGVPDGGTSSTAPADPAVGVTLAPGAGGSLIFAALPELSFATGLTFPYQSAAVVGSTATGTATIANRGPGSAATTIAWFAGATQLGTATVTLSAGSTYDFAAPFPVAAGTQTYSVHVSSATGEGVTTADDITTATLAGLPDLSLASLAPSDANPTPGEAVTLTAVVHNAGTAAVGPFDVTLYAGDPRFPQVAPVALQTQTVSLVGGNADQSRSFTLNLPTTAGDYVYTVRIDPAGAVAEAVESNNDAQYRVAFHADPAVPPISAASPLIVYQLNAGPTNNVQVFAYVENLGPVALTNVPVDVLVSRDGGPFVQIASQTFATLDPSVLRSLSLTVSSPTGDNVFRVQIDPAATGGDADPTNNFSQAELVVDGLADLSVATVSPSTLTPVSGGPLTLNATIANGGIADAAGVLVEVFAQAAGSTATPVLVGSTTLASVAAGASVAVAVPIATAGLGGPYTLTVQLNRLNAVAEADVSNDAAAVTVTVAGRQSVVLPAGQSNAITLSLDPYAAGFDDVWVNNPGEAGTPAQLLDRSLPVTIAGGGQTDTLTFDTSLAFTSDAGQALPVRLSFVGGTFVLPVLPVAYGKAIALPGPAHGTLLVAQSIQAIGFAFDNGPIDVGANEMALDFLFADQLLTTLTTAASFGFHGGAWDGTGIDSSAAAANPTHTTGVGVIVNNDGNGNALFGPGAPLGLFDGYGPSTSAVLVRYTYYGDANLDGRVNAADYGRIDAGYVLHRTGWFNGDFNYDGVVDGSDYTLADNAFNRQSGAAAAVVATAQSLEDMSAPKAGDAITVIPAADVRVGPEPVAPATAITWRASPFSGSAPITAAGTISWSTADSDPFWSKRKTGRLADLP